MDDLVIIENKIYEIRGQKVMLDFDLAEMYEIETKVLKQSVRRNIERFPEDFMFRLTEHEGKLLIDNIRSQNVTLSNEWFRYSPFAFTEQGVAMLSGILRSPKAIEVNINIMRAFVHMRQYLLSHAPKQELEELKKRIEYLEEDVTSDRDSYEKQFDELFSAFAKLSAAVFIVLTIYLSSILGFNDLEASMISGLFSGGLYLLPIFTGAYADKIGFRKSMIVAFSLLSVGYLGLGILPTLLEAAGLVEYGKATRFTGLPDSDSRWMIVPVLFVIMVGGSFIKSIISASVAKETTEANRARGYSIFYMMVNIGAFTGKTVIDPLRNVIGDQAYIYINYFSATMTILALLSVVLLYKSTHTAGEGKSMREIGQGFLRIITNWRLLILILIITGFWMVQQQLYATMPKYVIRMAGETAKPGWIANVNPFVVVCCVSFVTRLMAKRSAITSMNIGMFLIPFSALLMACGNLLGNDVISGMSNITLMMIAGIVIQALAECFISPRYLEYFSLQAPKGEEGMYLGFSHLHSFLSSIFGFGIAGVLLTKYCPDPVLFETREAWEAASANAHYIWYYFAAIGLISALALLVFAKITQSIDKKKKAKV